MNTTQRCGRFSVGCVSDHGQYKDLGHERRTWLVFVIPVVLVAIVASVLMVATVAHASVITHDTALCRYFPEFGSSLARAERTRPEWARHIRGTDRELHRNAASLNDYLVRHPHAHTTHGRYVTVYLNCNPDA
jgi:hypothetical protein